MRDIHLSNRTRHGRHRSRKILHEEIVTLQTLMTSLPPHALNPYLHEGMKVEIVRSPLKGVRDILLR
jgi:hypothetical protein